MCLPFEILQRIRRIPIEITTCVVEWRVNVGWCEGEYVALNYMHADIETLRTNILPSNVQCHEADPDDTLTITIPEYGSIDELDLSRGSCFSAFRLFKAQLLL